MQYFQKLADIPASPFESNAKVLSSEVLSIQGETRRKRSELALAVNGYGIEIRDMRSGSIVASYPRSLATPFTFTCPPCSIKLGNASSRSSKRLTYYFVNDPQPKLLCFSEKTGKTAGYSAQPESTSLNLPESGAPVVHIEAFAVPHGNADTPGLDILCIHQDGKISCYDEALTQRIWGPQNGFAPGASQSGIVPGKTHVVHASSISASKAGKTLLKDRDDVLGTLHANPGSFAPNLLLLVCRQAQHQGKNEQRKLLMHVLAIKSLQADAPEVSRSNKKLVQEILSLSIPEPKIQGSKRTVFRLHTPSGHLYQGTGRQLFIYNLTALAPQLVQTVTFEDQQNVLSYFTISPDTIAMLSGSSVVVMNTEFSSCRAKYELTMSNGSPNHFPVDAQFLTYHDPSASAIVLSGRKLLAVNFSEAIPSRPLSRKRKRNGLLVDAIGRGSLSANTRSLPSKRKIASSLALGDLVDPHYETAEWQVQEKAFNDLLEKDDHFELDRQISARLDKFFRPNVFGSHKRKITSKTHAPPRIVDYALSKMFSTSPRNSMDHEIVQREGELHASLVLGQTWQNLVRRGLISTERVEASLRRQDLLSPKNNLKDGGLIRALAEQDESLAALSDLLKSSCLVQISEVCHALKIVVARFSTLATGHHQKLLTNGDGPTGLNRILEDEMDLANDDPPETLRPSSTSSDHLNTLLDIIIARCNACPTSTVTKAFKNELSKSELQTLVILLRAKLRQDGWLSSYTDDGLTIDAEGQHKDRQISRIGKLMNCAVDSLGTGGWLLNNDLTDNAAEPLETISNMQAEISTALEGIWEANYLRAVLGELLICGKGALKSQTPRVHPALDWRGIPKTALPLGLKLEQDIPKTKVGAGGELQKRSKRDIGKLMSRRVPEYSFEQIAI
ncbi:MAG: hypothetical protein Q9168_004459 [Polycauliona sp. 1 TL-2023]